MRTFSTLINEALTLTSPPNTSQAFMKDFAALGRPNPMNSRELVIDDIVIVQLYPWNNHIYLMSIRTTETRTGAATAVMKKLLALADKHNIPIECTASPFRTGVANTLKKAALIRWYERLGFVKQLKSGMIYTPKGLMKETIPVQEGLPAQPDSDTTQVATTSGSYLKAALLMRPNLPPNAKVLDYGSGLGVGKMPLKDGLPKDTTIESYEPNPGRAPFPPTYTSTDQINDQYDGIVNLNVLNVLEPVLRERVLSHLISLLAPGGQAVIGTRKFAGDISTVKNSTPGKEPGSLWVQRTTKAGTKQVYQKGFDGAELQRYVQRIAGPSFTVTRINGVAANGVLVTKAGEIPHE